jgi:hypothetical protein
MTEAMNALKSESVAILSQSSYVLLWHQNRLQNAQAHQRDQPDLGAQLHMKTPKHVSREEGQDKICRGVTGFILLLVQALSCRGGMHTSLKISNILDSGQLVLTSRDHMWMDDSPLEPKGSSTSQAHRRDPKLS